MTAICHLHCGAVVSVAVDAQEGATDRSHVQYIPCRRVPINMQIAFIQCFRVLQVIRIQSVRHVMRRGSAIQYLGVNIPGCDVVGRWWAKPEPALEADLFPIPWDG